MYLPVSVHQCEKSSVTMSQLLFYHVHEEALRKRIVSYADKYDVIYNCQRACRWAKFTATAMVNIEPTGYHPSLLAFENKEIASLLSLDHIKNFDQWLEQLLITAKK